MGWLKFWGVPLCQTHTWTEALGPPEEVIGIELLVQLPAFLGGWRIGDGGHQLLQVEVHRHLGRPKKQISSGDIPNSMRGSFQCSHHPAEPRGTLVEPWSNPGRTLVEPWWNCGGTLVEPSWNLTSGPLRTTPGPIWAETPKLSAVGEKPNGFGLPQKPSNKPCPQNKARQVRPTVPKPAPTCPKSAPNPGFADQHCSCPWWAGGSGV